MEGSAKMKKVFMLFLIGFTFVLSSCEIIDEPGDFTIQQIDYDGTIIETDTFNYGDDLTDLAINEPYRMGYTFTGWDIELPDTMPENNLTITATYAINTYTLEHLDYDGSSLGTETFEYGADLTGITISTPNRTGYSFIEWSIELPDSMPASNLTITAGYEIKVNTVQFLDYDDTVIQTETAQYGTNLTITPLVDPIRNGYTFTGWNNQLNYEFPTTMPENDLAITATYAINTYTLEHLDYDGSSFGTETFDYGADLSGFAIVDPSRAGYTFIGWDVVLPNTMPGNDLTVTATYEISDTENLDTTIYIPDGYYNGIDGLTGETLKNTLNDIISNHTEYPYTDKDLDDMDVWKMVRAGDEDPDNSDNVLLFYSDFSWAKDCQDTNTSLLPDHCFVNSDRDEEYTEWNREHIWSKSHGEFDDEDGYAFEDSFGGYPLGAHTDAHHLVAAERSMNSIKNNRFFDDCHDGIDDDNLVDRGAGNYTCGEWYFEPRDEVKGDVARMLFYMATRYEGEEGDFVDLELTTNLYLYEDTETSISSSKLPYYENLEVLLRWHILDPVDEWELERNETIYQFQGNRNPFIDLPDLVEEIWGTPESPIEYESTTAE